MIRSRSLVTAVILQVVHGLFHVAAAIRILAAGSTGLPALPGAEDQGGPPFWAGVMFLVLAVATLFSAYGLWSGQKWGKVVTLVTKAILILFGLGDVIGAASIGAWPYFTISVADVVIGIAVVVLVLRRQQPKAVMA
jgi:hypothetical protein